MRWICILSKPKTEYGAPSTYIYTHTRTHARARTHTHTHTNTHAHIHTHAHTRTNAYTHTRTLSNEKLYFHIPLLVLSLIQSKNKDLSEILCVLSLLLLIRYAIIYSSCTVSCELNISELYTSYIYDLRDILCCWLTRTLVSIVFVHFE